MELPSGQNPSSTVYDALEERSASSGSPVTSPPPPSKLFSLCYVVSMEQVLNSAPSDGRPSQSLVALEVRPTMQVDHGEVTRSRPQERHSDRLTEPQISRALPRLPPPLTQTNLAKERPGTRIAEYILPAIQILPEIVDSPIIAAGSVSLPETDTTEASTDLEDLQSVADQRSLLPMLHYSREGFQPASDTSDLLNEHMYLTAILHGWDYAQTKFNFSARWQLLKEIDILLMHAKDFATRMAVLVVLKIWKVRGSASSHATCTLLLLTKTNTSFMSNLVQTRKKKRGIRFLHGCGQRE